MATADEKATPVRAAGGGGDPGAATGRGSGRKAWGFTGLLMLLYVVNWGDRAVYGVVAQPLADELGMTASDIGLVGSAFFLTFVVGSFCSALLHRAFVVKWALVVLAVAWAVAMLPMVFAATFTVLLVSRMLLGFAEGPASAMIHTAVYSWHPPEKRGLPSAIVISGASVGKIAVAPAMAVVVAVWGWRAAFLILAALGIAWCLVWVPTWQDGPYGKETAARATGDDADGAGAGPVHVAWSRILGSPTFLGATTAIMAYYATVAVVLTWLPSYFEVGLGYSRVQAGIMFGLPSVAGLALVFTASAVSDRLRSRGATSRMVRGIVPSAGLLACGVLLALLPYVGAGWVAVATVSIAYALGVSIAPLFNAALSEIVPSHQLAGTLGVFFGVMGIGGAIGPYLTGIIVENAASPAEGYELAFQIFGILALLGAVIALLTVNPERDKQRLLAAPAGPG